MKKINRNELIWMLILSALFVGLARLLLTGEILFFLHPKMIKFVIVTEVILFAMIVFQKSRIYTQTTTKVQMGQFVFLLPITVMMMRPTYLNSEAIVNKGLNLRQIPLSSETFQNVDLNKKSSEQTAEELGIGKDLVVEEETNKDNFLPLLDEIYTYPASKGKEYTLEGYVLTHDAYGKNRFLVGRMVVSCCIADATTEGVLCEMKDCPHFENNQWVRVTGVIEPLNETFPEEYDIPDFKLRVTKIQKIAPYESPYAYY